MLLPSLVGGHAGLVRSASPVIMLLSERVHLQNPFASLASLLVKALILPVVEKSLRLEEHWLLRGFLLLTFLVAVAPETRLVAVKVFKVFQALNHLLLHATIIALFRYLRI